MEVRNVFTELEDKDKELEQEYKFLKNGCFYMFLFIVLFLGGLGYLTYIKPIAGIAIMGFLAVMSLILK